MEEMKCTGCGAVLANGEPHCSMCQSSMTCSGTTCTCTCGNMVNMNEVKCDKCLAM